MLIITCLHVDHFGTCNKEQDSSYVFTNKSLIYDTVNNTILKNHKLNNEKFYSSLS